MALRRGLTDNVRFIGYLERRTELPLLLCGDVFVFASRTETQGWCCWKQWRSACRCGAGRNGTKDVLKEGEGCRIAPDDVAGLPGAGALLADRAAARRSRDRQALCSGMERIENAIRHSGAIPRIKARPIQPRG